jgi:triphosphoribosyl-dephospho-CoA synthetase
MRNRRGERDTEDVCKKIRQLERKCMGRELQRERKEERKKERKK